MKSFAMTPCYLAALLIGLKKSRAHRITSSGVIKYSNYVTPLFPVSTVISIVPSTPIVITFTEGIGSSLYARHRE